MLRPESSVGIMSDYGLDRPGYNPVGDYILRPFRLTLGLTPLPMEGLSFFPGVKKRPGRAVDHSPSPRP